MKMNQFFTRPSGNKGREVFIPLPNGNFSEETLHILSIDSDTFRLAETAARREITNAAVDCTDKDSKGNESFNQLKYDNMVFEAQLRMTASVITEWSFEDEFNIDNVIEFLRQAPHVREFVDSECTKRAKFVDSSLTSSTSSQKKK